MPTIIKIALMIVMIRREFRVSLDPIDNRRPLLLAGSGDLSCRLKEMFNPFFILSIEVVGKRSIQDSDSPHAHKTAILSQGCVDQLNEILDCKTLFVAGRFDGVAEHGDILGTGDDKSRHVIQLDCLTDAGFAGPLLDFPFCHPDATAASTAAEGSVPVARHLHQITTRGLNDPARSVEDTVVAA